MRLVVTDKALYPTKENIEQSYRTRSILSCKGDVKNIFDIYKLEDHTGNEITISELVDKYLNNPELCFKKGWELPLYYSEGPYNVRVDPNPNPDSEMEYYTCTFCNSRKLKSQKVLHEMNCQSK